MDPVLAALLGIVVGAVLKGAVDLGLDEYRQRKQRRAALRLLGQDLSDAQSTLKTALHNREWWPPAWALTWSAWDDHRELLAARLKARDWLRIAGAFSLLQGISAHVAEAEAKQTATMGAGSSAGPPEFGDTDAKHVERVLHFVAQARESISDLLGSA